MTTEARELRANYIQSYRGAGPMTGQCQSAGKPCERLATLVVRIAGVGDRSLCEPCYRSMSEMGMAVRRLDDVTYLPAWRQRNLARDETRLA